MDEVICGQPADTPRYYCRRSWKTTAPGNKLLVMSSGFGRIPLLGIMALCEIGANERKKMRAAGFRTGANPFQTPPQSGPHKFLSSESLTSTPPPDRLPNAHSPPPPLDTVLVFATTRLR